MAPPLSVWPAGPREYHREPVLRINTVPQSCLIWSRSLYLPIPVPPKVEEDIFTLSLDQGLTIDPGWIIIALQVPVTAALDVGSSGCTPPGCCLLPNFGFHPSIHSFVRPFIHPSVCVSVRPLGPGVL